MLACHAGDPGPIPGQCTFLLFFFLKICLSSILSTSILLQYNHEFCIDSNESFVYLLFQTRTKCMFFFSRNENERSTKRNLSIAHDYSTNLCLIFFFTRQCRHFQKALSKQRITCVVSNRLFLLTFKAVLTPLISSKNVSCPKILFNSKNVTAELPKIQPSMILLVLVEHIHPTCLN